MLVVPSSIRSDRSGQVGLAAGVKALATAVTIGTTQAAGGPLVGAGSGVTGIDAAVVTGSGRRGGDDCGEGFHAVDVTAGGIVAERTRVTMTGGTGGGTQVIGVGGDVDGVLVAGRSGAGAQAGVNRRTDGVREIMLMTVGATEAAGAAGPVIGRRGMTAVGAVGAVIGDGGTGQIDTGGVILMTAMRAGDCVGPVTEVAITGRQEDGIVAQVSAVLVAGRRIAALIQKFAGRRVTVDTGVVTGGIQTILPLTGGRIVATVGGGTGPTEIGTLGVADRHIHIGTAEIDGAVSMLAAVADSTRPGMRMTIVTAADITAGQVGSVNGVAFGQATMVAAVGIVTGGTGTAATVLEGPAPPT